MPTNAPNTVKKLTPSTQEIYSKLGAPVILYSGSFDYVYKPLNGNEKINYFARELNHLHHCCKTYEHSFYEEKLAEHQFFKILKFLAQKNRLTDLFNHYLALEVGDEKQTPTLHKASSFHIDAFLQHCKKFHLEKKDFLPLLNLIVEKRKFSAAVSLCKLFPGELFADNLYVVLTDIMVKANDLKNALELVDLVLASNPSPLILCQVLVGKATVHEKLGENTKAMDYFTQALQCTNTNDIKEKLQQRLSAVKKLIAAEQVKYGGNAVHTNHFSLDTPTPSRHITADSKNISAASSPAVSAITAVGSPPEFNL